MLQLLFNHIFQLGVLRTQCVQHQSVAGDLVLEEWVGSQGLRQIGGNF